MWRSGWNSCGSFHCFSLKWVEWRLIKSRVPWMNQTKCFSRWKIMDIKWIVTSGMVYPCSLVSTVAWWGTAKGVTLLNLRTSISTASVYGKLQTSYFTSVIFRRPFHNEMDQTIAIMFQNGQPRHFSYWHICYHHKKKLKTLQSSWKFFCVKWWYSPPVSTLCHKLPLNSSSLEESRFLIDIIEPE